MNSPRNREPQSGSHETLKRRLIYGGILGGVCIAASYDKNLDSVVFDPRPSIRAFGFIATLVSAARGLRYLADVQTASGEAVDA